jgi:hypothetical protein
MSYIVGVSSGAFGVAEARERPELVGLFKKAQSCITRGVQFVQLDLESLSEFEEPNLKEKMESDIVKKLGVTFGIHSETKAFGVEAAELDSAIRMEYERAHKRLIDILKKAGEIGSKYVLIHSSESDPFPLVALRTQSTDLVDFYGRPFKEFLDENKWLLDWIIEKEGKFIWEEVLHESLEEYIRYHREAWTREIKEFYLLHFKREPTEEELKKALDEREKELKERLKRYFCDIVSSKTLHYGPERWAYFLVAKWMEQKPLWKKIVEVNLKFFAARDKKTVEEWAKEKNINLQKLSIDDPNFRNNHEIWVPAVSAQYIWGHMNPKIPATYPDPKPLIEKYKMPLVLETPMAERGVEEWLRFYNPLHIFCLAEEVGTNYIQLALDLEHMLSIRLDPETVISLFPEGAGKFVKVIHAGWPATLAPAHLPIYLGSDQQLYLYKMYYLLRKKGFGLDPNIDHFIVFERGGPETFQESVIALRKIVEFLEKDIPPERLPPEFFGIATGEIASEERQLATIREHAYDPLKGLLMVPEEEYTFLSRAALEKPGVTPEKWKKEELR